jgi:hypothetical protein
VRIPGAPLLFACLERRGVERVDRLAVLGRQRDVKSALHWAPLRFDPEEALAVLAESGGLAHRLEQEVDPKWGEGLLVEGLAATVVADGESNVVKHSMPPPLGERSCLVRRRIIDRLHYTYGRT